MHEGSDVDGVNEVVYGGDCVRWVTGRRNEE
jgi:hypothetical protein